MIRMPPGGSHLLEMQIQSNYCTFVFMNFFFFLSDKYNLNQLSTDVLFMLWDPNLTLLLPLDNIILCEKLF